MIDLSHVWGIARAEMRLTRRLVRFWIFVVLGGLFTLLTFANFVFIHWMFSFGSASAASAYPRYFMGTFGARFVLVFLFGLVFLGYDLRARDKRERIVEVTDALPCTNLEWVLGRYVGLLIPGWAGAIVTTAILAIVAAAIGMPIEPLSMITFGLWQAIPAYTFTIGLVFFLTLLLRHRLIASLVSLALIGVAFVGTIWWIPVSDVALMDITGGMSIPFPSDITGRIIELDGMLQRTGYLLAGFALLFFAAAVHPRLDQASRGKQWVSGFVLLVVGAGLCGAVVLKYRGMISQKRAWREAHAARSADPVPDMLAMSGDVRIESGGRLDMDLELRFRAPETATLERALFSLNPGLGVETIGTSESGDTLDFEQADGLLEIRLPSPLGPGEEMAVTLVAQGEVDPTFAYLDATIDPLGLVLSEAQIFILGYDAMLCERRFCALMPGARWLPASGSDVGRGDPAGRPSDFFEIDLVVDTPEAWVVAGPGRRRQAAQPAEKGRARHRFAPGAPLPEVALVAGRYESRSAEIEGVELEMLVHPRHAASLEIFEDAAHEIRDWLSEQLRDADELGLGYPYDGLTMVEVPNRLRGYAGGWRMDSTLIQPAVILMRESGFPTARFSWGFRNPERFRDREGGLPRRKREILEAFFENDVNGGNPFVAAARSFFGYQTASEGPEGLPLDFVCEHMTTRLLTDKRGYFSIHMFDQDFGQDFARAGQAMGDPDRVGEEYADVLIHMLISNPQVWDTVLEVSLDEMDPWEDPERAINVLNLKGGAMAESMLDGLGREKAGAVLAALRSGHSGEAFTREDMLAAGTSVGVDLAPWLDVWLGQTDLPGFTVGHVTVERIRDADDGSPRYQSLVTVRNEESVAGLVRLQYRVGEGRSEDERGFSDPVRVPGDGAVSIGLVTAEVPRALRVAPYLALNRDPFNVNVPAVDEEKVADREPFVGAREVDATPRDDGVIVVDDLDEGFSVEESDERGMMRLAGRGGEEDLDQGLPIALSPRRTTQWSRMSVPAAYGKYRHTFAVVRAGKGQRQAIFSAAIPRSGEWELEYFVPPSRRGRRSGGSRGTWNLTVTDSSAERELTFDADAGDGGWNSLGTFEIADGEVLVSVSDVTDGGYVIADAIRWTPVSSGARVVASR